MKSGCWWRPCRIGCEHDSLDLLKHWIYLDMHITLITSEHASLGLLVMLKGCTCPGKLMIHAVPEALLVVMLMIMMTMALISGPCQLLLQNPVH